MNQYRRKSSPARAAMKLLCLMLGLILTAMLAATAYFYPIMTNLSAGAGRDLDAKSLLSAMSQDLSRLVPGDKDAIGGPGSGIVNILLVGQDAREGENGSRSDSMVLCTFNKHTKKLILTSFLRDLYVKIPGNGSNRLNAAYAYGGSELLEKTLEENFGLRIDGYVEADFSQFSAIVDALGGVELDIRQDEAEFINYETGSELGEGRHLLYGDQVLAYSRIRKLDADGDFSRTDRQRKVLSAIMLSIKGLGTTQMLKVANQLLPLINTNIGSFSLLRYAVELYPVVSGGQVVSQSIPTAQTCRDETIDGMRVLVPDLPGCRELLKKTLLEQE